MTKEPMTAVAEDVLDEEEMVACRRNLLVVVVEEDFLVEEEDDEEEEMQEQQVEAGPTPRGRGRGRGGPRDVPHHVPDEAQLNMLGMGGAAQQVRKYS
jgi:hypothetical protein